MIRFITKSLLILVLCLVLSPINKTVAEAPLPVEPKTSWTVEEVKDLVDKNAHKYGIDAQQLHLLVWNESHYIYNLPGDNYNSWGACQIHLPSHPYITKAQANNPEFCLDWMANKIAIGQGKMWTTYRTCVLKQTIWHQGRQIKCFPLPKTI